MKKENNRVAVMICIAVAGMMIYRNLQFKDKADTTLELEKRNQRIDLIK